MTLGHMSMQPLPPEGSKPLIPKTPPLKALLLKALPLKAMLYPIRGPCCL